MNWLQDSKSAILRNQPTCCTYELNLRPPVKQSNLTRETSVNGKHMAIDV